MSTLYEQVEDLGPNYVRELSVVYRGPRRRFDRLKSSRDVDAFARKLGLDELVVEHFVVICLDAKHRPIGWWTASVGGLSACGVAPSDVLRVALKCATSGMVLLHNHPSGEPTPSAEDIALTERLVRAGELMGIPVLDHVIVAEESYSSFLDMGLIGRKP